MCLQLHLCFMGALGTLVVAKEETLVAQMFLHLLQDLFAVQFDLALNVHQVQEAFLL